ncbi:hypothetical protein AWM70_02265 [Paenibacillus yonginensis]|uniref:Uncharacterized protein n=1 Tax=Paenibacillus yonginensis TaxID=1462996 RepID=A0A1B1MWJ5_9BACL|nr:TadE family protein [Paenibacillus yonginensis]ANS73544.1 hypothetical protein AWM70_02265 [Paenibacillus yonginensis]
MRLIPISRLRQKPDREASSGGSMVLEAALVLPLFILFVFFFSYMVQMTLISTRMHTAVVNSVKQISSNVYPVYLAVQASEQGGDRKDNGGSGEEAELTKPSGGEAGFTLPKLSIPEFTGIFADKLPSPVSKWLTDAVESGKEPIEELKTQTAETLLDPALNPVLKPFLEEAGLNPDRAHISKVAVPDLKAGKTPYFGIEISYELPIRVPFTGNKLFLQAKAYERLWIGDTHELEKDGGDGQDKAAAKPVVLDKPNPAYAGSKATIKAQIAPGGTANLTIYYKSGKSTAKYLGTATADEKGILTWTWLVGGNTTPGTWEFMIETPEGGGAEDIFNVESPGQRNG